MKNSSSGIFTTYITKEQSKDSGMAVVLIFLLIGFFTKENTFFVIAVGALLLNMVFPLFYYPFAILWFGLSKALGAVMTKVILSVIYLIVLLPVALIRKFIGKDPLYLKKYKRGKESVMRDRNHIFEPTDLEKPF